MILYAISSLHFSVTRVSGVSPDVKLFPTPVLANMTHSSYCFSAIDQCIVEGSVSKGYSSIN